MESQNWEERCPHPTPILFSESRRLLFRGSIAIGSRSVVGCQLPAASCLLSPGMGRYRPVSFRVETTTMTARRSRPMFPRCDPSTLRPFDHSTRLLPAACCKLPAVSQDGSLSALAPWWAASCELPAVCGAGSLSALAVVYRRVEGGPVRFPCVRPAASCRLQAASCPPAVGMCQLSVQEVRSLRSQFATLNAANARR